jgi:hypothetical protein
MTIPKELCFMKHTVRGTTYALVYGTEENKALVARVGMEAMMIPRMCIQLQPFQMRIMHTKDGWTSPAWPFMTVSTRATATVIPFDHDGYGVFADLVFVFPKGYMCKKVLPEWHERMTNMKKRGMTVEWRLYADCDQVMISKLDVGGLVSLTTYILQNSSPVIITLKSSK